MPWEKTFDLDEATDKAIRVFWTKGYEATSMAGFHGAARISHTDRQLSPDADVSQILFAKIQQFADAEFDFLPWRLRDPRHGRDQEPGAPGFA